MDRNRGHGVRTKDTLLPPDGAEFVNVERLEGEGRGEAAEDCVEIERTSTF